MSFPSTHPALARALAEKNYSDPTAVQSAVLEDRAAGKDLLVSAQTGSGKTVAFGLSLAPTLLGDAERFDRAAEPLALVIAPTRELAMQVHRELTWLYAETGARIVTCVGGMDPRAEARQLGFGTHVVVGTPGRLRDHIERGRLDLSKLKAVVLDEADEMLDLGFREDLEFILDRTPGERRTLLFSATLPRDIQTLAGNYQRDAVRIETIRQNEQHADIEYFAARVMPNDVENAIVNTIRFHDAKAIVFCATREAVKRTHARLVERGFAAVAISGELTQAERTNAIVALRDGRARILVATDVAARGLDLPDLTLVIHADLPNDRETLLHRSGRTGRAGKKGMSILIVPHFRRRRAGLLLGQARVKASWGTPPSAEAVHARDRERFLADPIFTDASAEGEDEAVRLLQSMRTPDEIARALLRLNATRLPEPEELTPDAGPPRREFRDRDPRQARQDRSERFDRGARGDRPDRKTRDQGERHGHNQGDRRERGLERTPRPAREDGRPMVWFRINIGRERNADPKWLLPLICKAGDVTRSEIGSIKIHDRDTRFQIVADRADAFDTAVRTNKQKQGHISRVRASDAAHDGPPRDGPPRADDGKQRNKKPFKPKARDRKAPAEASS